MPEAGTDMQVGEGARVTLHFSLALTDGSVIDSNFEGKPATFVVGDGSLLPGFEEALFGLRAGEKLCITLPPERAFGPVNPENVQSLLRHRYASLLESLDQPLQPGTVLAFADGGGNDIPGIVRDIDDEVMIVDFNHPLAGRAIDFSAEILAVIPAGVQSVRIQST